MAMLKQMITFHLCSLVQFIDIDIWGYKISVHRKTCENDLFVCLVYYVTFAM